MLLCYYLHDRQHNVRASENHTKTPVNKLRSVPHFKDSCFNEHSVVELRNGRLWMPSRCHTEIAQTFSDDGGATWQPQQTTFPHVNSKCCTTRLRSGNILLIKHGTDLDLATTKCTDLTAFLSGDDGAT